MFLLIMKKFFMILVGALILGTTAMKAQSEGTTFILRGGFATNSFVGDDMDHSDMLPGYNVGLDMNKFIKNGLYWNTGIMFGSRGYQYEDVLKFRAHNLQIPLTIGYKYDLGSGFALDGRIGGFFSVDMAGKYKYDSNLLKDTKISDIDDYNRCDGGLLIGVGVWYNNINLDLAYQRGFAHSIDNLEGAASNFLIRLGIAF